MVEYGSILDDGVVIAERAEVEFHPCRWAGSLKFVAKTNVVSNHVYVLRMEDGQSSEIEFDTTKSLLLKGPDSEETSVSATFRRANL